MKCSPIENDDKLTHSQRNDRAARAKTKKAVGKGNGAQFTKYRSCRRWLNNFIHKG